MTSGSRLAQGGPRSPGPGSSATRSSSGRSTDRGARSPLDGSVPTRWPTHRRPDPCASLGAPLDRPGGGAALHRCPPPSGLRPSFLTSTCTISLGAFRSWRAGASRLVLIRMPMAGSVQRSGGRRSGAAPATPWRLPNRSRCATRAGPSGATPAVPGSAARYGSECAVGCGAVGPTPARAGLTEGALAVDPALGRLRHPNRSAARRSGQRSITTQQASSNRPRGWGWRWRGSRRPPG